MKKVANVFNAIKADNKQSPYFSKITFKFIAFTGIKSIYY